MFKSYQRDMDRTHLRPFVILKLDLSINSYLNLVRYIYEFWNSIPSVTKRKICPYFNPFQEGLQNINFGILGSIILEG